VNTGIQASIVPPEINLILAWVWIMLGFISGLGLGLFFHREGWLGGYAGHKRRLLRLGHISFFGLGAVNLCFFLTVQAKSISGPGPAVQVASWCFVIGALSMPVCCLIMAFFPKALLLFAIPVVTLLTAAALTVASVVSHTSALSSRPLPAFTETNPASTDHLLEDSL